MHSPKDDGITHINIYSKGATVLGRQLSNFALTPFVHTDYGQFASVEGLWYYVGTGCRHEVLRTLHGYAAKKRGSEFTKVEKEHFNDIILEGIRCKLRQHHDLRRLLAESSLPFAHYYYYGVIGNANVIELPQYDWIVAEIERIRTVIQGGRK